MFRKKREYHRRNSFLPMVIFRMLLSLSMFLILGLGVYQAYRYFTGTDPLKIDPRATAFSLISSPSAANFINTIFGAKIPAGLADKLGQKEILSQSSSRADGKTSGRPALKFALVADSHKDNNNLAKALSQAGQEGAKFVIGLGDYSDVGTVEELQKAREVFLSSKLPHYLTAGDHDLWDSRNRGLTPSANFNQLFGPAYQSFVDSNIRFIILFNSDNYLGMDPVERQWLEDTLSETTSAKQTFVFLHEPLYHPSSDHMMGKEKPELVSQAAEIAGLLGQAKVGEVFASDIHAFSQYSDPKSGLKMTTVGALTTERNAQKPRFAIVDVFEDGGYNIEDVEVK